MKKLLILTTSTGEGHNQAANSLKEVFLQDGFEVIQFDFLKPIKLINEVIVRGYEISASKTPHFYGFFYHLTNFNYINQIANIFLFPLQKILLNKINEVNPDLIIATHALSINMLSKLKRKNLLDVPFCSVVTDFKAHKTYLSKDVDAYITGSNYTNESLSKCNIDKNKIFDFGIPIKKQFYCKDESTLKENEAAVTFNNKDCFNILLMSGSMGLSNISTVLKEVVKNPNKLKITVICGKNKTLKDNLSKLYSNVNYDNKEIHILGFTTNIFSIMDDTDLIISKPGGLTSTEALVKNVPIIIPFVIPGQESENSEFLTESNCAMCIKKLHNLNSVINDMIENPEILNKMKQNMKTVSSNYSLDKIVSLANNLIKSK